MDTLQSVRKSVRSPRQGAVSVEYAALLGLIIAAAAGGLVALGNRSTVTFNQTSNPATKTPDQPTSSVQTPSPSLPSVPAPITQPPDLIPTPPDQPPSDPNPALDLSPLFSDSFDSKNSSKAWKWSGEGWEVRGGKLRVGFDDDARGEQRALAKHDAVGDCLISVDAHLIQGDGYGVFFRVSGEKLNGYSFQYDPGYGGGQFIMRKWVNGYEIWPPFAAVAAPKQNWYGGAQHVEVTAIGSTFVAKINGTIVLTGRDATYQSGITGLRTWSGGKATFDDYSVTQLR